MCSLARLGAAPPWATPCEGEEGGKRNERREKGKGEGR